jgi:hypothetical protein
VPTDWFCTPVSDDEWEAKLTKNNRKGLVNLTSPFFVCEWFMAATKDEER